METISLRLPSTYVEVNGSEMEYLDGAGLFSSICKWVGGIVAGVGLASSAIGAVVGCFCPQVGVPMFALGWVGYIGGMYILAMGGHIDINNYEFG